MEEPGKVRQIHPKWVIVAVVVIGVVGAAGVYVGGSILHRKDREAIGRWEREALPLIVDAEQVHATLPSLERSILRAPSGRAGRAGALRGQLQAHRTTLQAALRDLDAVPLPGILETTASHSYTGARQTLEAVTYLERLLSVAPRDDAAIMASYDEAWETARSRFAQGRTALTDVRCLAKVPDCSEIGSPVVTRGMGRPTT